MRKIDYNYLVFLAACIWAVFAFTGCSKQDIKHQPEKLCIWPDNMGGCE